MSNTTTGSGPGPQRPLQAPHGPSGDGAILSAAAVAEAGVLAADVCRVLRQSAEMFGLLAESHEALRAALACQTAALAAMQAERDAARDAVRDVLWILKHGEIRGMEGMAMFHGARYSAEFFAEAGRRREAAERLVGWGLADGADAALRGEEAG